VFWLPAGSKRPRQGSRGKDDATTDIDLLEATLDADFPGSANLAGTPPAGVFYLDIDLKNGKDGAASLRTEFAQRAAVPVEFIDDPIGWLRSNFPTQRSWSGGWHFLMRHPVDRVPGRCPLGDAAGVECGVTAKHYLLLEPSVVKENGRSGSYTWDEAPPLPDDIPQAPPWLLDVVAPIVKPNDSSHVPTTSPIGADERVLRMAVTSLAALGTQQASAYESWYRVLAILKSIESACGEEVVLDLADDWSKQAQDKYSGREEVRSKLASFKRTESAKRLTIASLVHMAEEARRSGLPGWANMPKRWARLCAHEDQAREDLLEAMLLDGSWARIYSKDDPPPKQEFIIEPAIIADALNFFHAPPKSSKSNILFHVLCEALRGRDPIPGALRLGARPPRCILLVTEMPEAMTHAFLDLYDPSRDLRASGRLLVASREFKLLLSPAHEMRRVLTRVIEAKQIDIVAIDTFTAFSSLGSGDSISEAADTLQVVSALLSLPATVVCTHHDRKAGDGSNAHVHMLGSTAIRAASSANLSVRLVDEASTLMRAELEARDPAYLGWLARCAEAAARGEPPPSRPAIPVRGWWLRLGHDKETDRVVYRVAEADLVPEEAAKEAGKGRRKASHDDVRGAVLEALERLHSQEAERAETEGRRAIQVFAVETVLCMARVVWDERPGPAPGRPTVASALKGLDIEGCVLQIAQGQYPGAGRRAGYGLPSHVPSNAHPRGQAPPLDLRPPAEEPVEGAGPEVQP